MDPACIRHNQLPGTSRLFADYLYSFERVAGYYSHNPNAIDKLPELAKAIEYPDARRDAMVTALRAQNGPSANLDKLARAGTVAVVTGQQVGLFSGPAYTIYKALTAVRVARELSAQGTPAVPVFWLATEDHDFPEISKAWVFGPSGVPVSLSVEPPLVVDGPVGPVVPAKYPLHELAAALKGFESADEVIEIVRGAKGTPYDDEFEWLGTHDAKPAGVGLFYLDHLTHNVHRGRMDVWAGFYQNLFSFRQIRYFDIEGKMTGLFSKALTSPDGKIRIPINESADANSQIEEYLHAYAGEGIQHIACGCLDVYASVEALRVNGLAFMPAPPPTYYARVEGRLPGHGEPLDRLKRDGILIDGEGVVDGKETKLLLQIFSANAIGPIFFEFIQRKGDDGFGEGNFKALFESIEEDQIRRGVLTASDA